MFRSGTVTETPTYLGSSLCRHSSQTTSPSRTRLQTWSSDWVSSSAKPLMTAMDASQPSR